MMFNFCLYVCVITVAHRNVELARGKLLLRAQIISWTTCQVAIFVATY